MDEILRFPNHEGSSAYRIPSCPSPELPTLQRFDPNRTLELYQLAAGVSDKAKALVKFIDSDRALARAVGIETIAIELSAIVDGTGLQQVIDTLEESSSQGKSSEITFGGLERLRRAEKLLAEASASIELFTKLKDVGGAAYLGRPSARESVGLDVLMLIQVAVLGAIGVAVVIAAVSKKSIENR